MRIKTYIPIFISLGLAIISTNVYAKTHTHSVKKHAVIPAKRNKLSARKTRNQRPVPVSRKQSPDKAMSFQIERANSGELQQVRTPFHSYPLTSASDTDPLLKATIDKQRIHTELAPQKNYLTENPPSFEIPLHFSSTHGVIETSFTHAGHKAGLSEELMLELSKIFAWDIDFASSLLPGDQFTVIYKESQSVSKFRNSDQILAAEFITQGKIFTAVRYKDQNGFVNYYTPEGKSMHKAFLSAPVDFSRISSHFGFHRKHPVLNRIRAHKGVDYAARTGTPVKSAGDGIVSFRGRKGGYGQVMIIRHGEHYETLYAHLSDFKKGLQTGDTVRQGEIIGYVGQTGLATGPHLHYEFRIDGVHQNPETLAQQHSVPLGPNLMPDFKAQTHGLLAQLYRAKAINLMAKSNNN